MAMNVRNEKGMAFIAALSVYAILMVVTATFLWMTDSDLNISTNQRDTTKALYIGEAGIEYGIYKLLADWSWTGTGSPVNLGDGEFEVSVTELADLRKEILSTGICQQALAMGRIVKSKRKIQVIINPTAFKYAVFSTGNVQLRTAFFNSSGLVGTGDEGNVHSNRRVSVWGNVTVEGDITERSPTVFIPNVDMNAYRTDPRTNFSTGNLTITTANQGSYQNMVVYRTGRIRIRANTGPITLNGTTLVAEGNIEIEGDYAITINPDDEPLEDTAYPSLVTENGDITGYFNDPDNSNLELLVFTKNGQINLQNLMMAKGSVIAGVDGAVLRATRDQKFRIIYDNTILTTNKPKYFTTSVDAASLFWKEVY